MKSQFILRISCIFLIHLIAFRAPSQPFVTLPAQLGDQGFAEWITPYEETGVFCFRKMLELEQAPDSFPVHVSADARYKLYVNGNLVSWGPAAGDLLHWNYESVDLAPFLITGKNVIAATVWNWRTLNPARQISIRTAFILQGDSEPEWTVNTDGSWKVTRHKGYHALPVSSLTAGGGYIAGATDSVCVSPEMKGWKTIGYNDSGWPWARPIGKGNHRGLDTWKGTPWNLQARSIPAMTRLEEPSPYLVDVSGWPAGHEKTAPLTEQRLTGSLPLVVPPHSEVKLLLDNRVLTMGYPRLSLSGGEGSRIRLRYQEALFNEDGTKGHRDRWEGKTMRGYYDVYFPGGGAEVFEPLWIRVFRYLQLTVRTGDESLIIDDFTHLYTAYPLEQKATFSCGSEEIDRIWEASWRTARLCALETYMDCPYYEQLQYTGDSRIQAMISCYVAGDTRLARNAIYQLYHSMQPMGLTKSAHPTEGVQIIPPFSLLLIGMIHDYYMHADDPDFIRPMMPGIRFILDWFTRHIGEDGIMGPLPYWNHIDGGTRFTDGSPPGISEGGSSHMTLLLAYAADLAGELFTEFGMTYDAERFLDLAAGLKAATMTHCFAAEKGLIAETPEKQIFSQHTNIFGILSGAVPKELQKELAGRILTDTTLIRTTLYFKYYLFRALKMAGLGEAVPDLLQEWSLFLDHGFSTFPEHGLNSRSDCHAWSAHPLIDLLTITCGIESSAPGFREVEIRPSPAGFKKLSGSVPHPGGTIRTHYEETEAGRWNCRISLPEGVSGSLHFRGEKFMLSPGENQILTGTSQ